MNAEKNKKHINKIVMVFAILGLILISSSGCIEISDIDEDVDEDIDEDVEAGYDWIKDGDMWRNLENYDDALIAYNIAIVMEPNKVDAWYKKGYVLSKLGRYEEALEAYNRAIEIKPDNDKVWYNKGNLLIKLNRYEEALEAYNRAIEINPNYYQAWYNKGIVLKEELDCYEEALEAYNRAIEINPNYTRAWNNKGFTLEELGRYEEALEAYNRAIEINPNFYLAWYNKGIVLDKLGRYEESDEAYNIAIEKDTSIVDSDLNTPSDSFNSITDSDGSTNYEVWKGDIPNSYYTLGMYGERVVQVTGKPWMIVKYNKVTLEIEDVEFGLSEVTQKVLPTSESLAFLRPTLDATMFNQENKKLNINSPVDLIISWDNPYYDGKSIATGVQTFSVTIHPMGRNIEVWTFTHTNGVMTGYVKNLDDMTCAGSESETNAFQLRKI